MVVQFSINAASLVSVCLSKLVYILGAELGGFRTDAELSFIFFLNHQPPERRYGLTARNVNLTHSDTTGQLSYRFALCN